MKEPAEHAGLVDPEVEAAVRESFARQTVMGSIGASLVRVCAGEVVIAIPFSPAWERLVATMLATIMRMEKKR